MASEIISPSSGISSQARRSSWPRSRMRCTPNRPSSGGQRVQPAEQVAPGRAGRSGAGPACRRAPPARWPASSSGASGRLRLATSTGSQRARARARAASGPRRASGSNFQPEAFSTPVCSKPSACVQGDRAGVVRVADHGQHLARAARLAARHQLGQQQPADAAAAWPTAPGRSSPRRRSGRRGAGGSGWHRRSRARRRRSSATSQGRPLSTHVGAAAGHLGVVRRLELEGAGAVQHMVGVDGGDGRQVGGQCWGGCARVQKMAGWQSPGVYNARFPATALADTRAYLRTPDLPDLAGTSSCPCAGRSATSIPRNPHGRDPTGPWWRQEAPVLQHRRCRLARAPRRPLHRARRLLQPDGRRRRASRCAWRSTASPTGPASAPTCRPPWPAWSTQAKGRRSGGRCGRSLSLDRPVTDASIRSAPEPQQPADAVEVGRVLGAWGVQGGIKVKPFAADPQALFSTKRWFLEPPDRARARRRAVGPADAAAHRQRARAGRRRRRHRARICRTATPPRRCRARASSSRAPAFRPPTPTSSTGST